MKLSDTVTIICITYNHQDWIEETLESVRMQDYYSKELIIVDNGSGDETVDVVKKWINQSSGGLSVRTFFHETSLPYCQVFNEALQHVNSQYVVDLAGDDLLYPEHLSLSIAQLKKAPFAAFVFSDAYIMEKDGMIQTFYKRRESGELVEKVETLGIYETLVRKNYICSPTIVFNAPLLMSEGGYDASLAYEDFDIQLRLARKFTVVFSDHIGVLKRKHDRSLSSGQYQRYQSEMLPSTLKVCRKAQQMNKHSREDKALGTRVLHELKHALWSANFEPAAGLVQLGEEIGLKGVRFWLYKLWLKLRVDISWVYAKIT